MPIANIVDHRTNKYDVEVDCAFEPSWHDSSIKGATKFTKPKSKKEFYIDSLNKTTIEDAINYINNNNRYKDIAITMFLYDAGSNPCGDEEEYFDMD
jgi:hypothetical protein